MSKEIRQSTTEQLRSVNREDRTVEIIASTFDIDSHGTRIDPAGWDLEAFKKNPVICLQHDDRGYTDSNGLPIANAIPESIRIDSHKLTMRIRFPEKGKFPLADQVFELVADGFMRGVSVGFEPIEYEDVDEEKEGEKKRVRVYRKQRLLETSLVTIPSNDNALVIRARDLNADEKVIRSITEQLEQTIQQQEEEKTAAYVQKCISYFEKKQPANREATKAMEKFYKRILKEEQPADEIAAWQRMGDAIEAMEEKDEVVTDTTVATIETVPQETTVTTTEEEITPPTTPAIPAEAPQDARKAYVQLPLSALPALQSRILETCVEAVVKASQQGVPESEWNGLIDATGNRFRQAVFQPAQ